MNIIKTISAQMFDELDGCREYCICCLDNKESRPELSQMYRSMANQEYEHAMHLHELAVRLANEAKARPEQPPAFMLERWNAIHEAAMTLLAETKTMLDLCK